MAKQQRRQISPQDDTEEQADTVYKIVEVVGVSEKSWEDAGRNAVETAAGSLRDLRVAEVTKMDMKLENGKVAAFHARLAFLQIRGLILVRKSQRGVARVERVESRRGAAAIVAPVIDLGPASPRGFFFTLC
jgi:dodecin